MPAGKKAIFCDGNPATKKAFQAFHFGPEVSHPSVASQTSLNVGISGNVGSRTMSPFAAKEPQVIIGTALPASTIAAEPFR